VTARSANVLMIMLAAALLTGCSESTPPLAPPISPSIQTITVSASTKSLVVGDSVEVRAIVIGSDGSPFPLATVGWKSSNIAIATVTATGPLTAEVRTISAGSVGITASIESHSSQIRLDVSLAPPPPPETSPALAFLWSRESGMMALTFPADAGRSFAADINDLGQVVGSVLKEGTFRAFVWTLESGMVDIGVLDGSVSSTAAAINNAGQVAGSSQYADHHRHAFRWSPSEGMIALPMPPGTKDSFSRDINAGGEIVGERNGSNGPISFRWSREKGTVDLTPLGSDSYAAGMAIGDNGDIVGYSGHDDNDESIQRSVLWSPDGTKKIIDECTRGYIAYDFSYNCRSSADAISSAGQIAGNSDIGGTSVPFRLTLGGNLQDIPGIPGSRVSDARAINEAGQVVGSSRWDAYGQFGRAYFWSPISGTVDLGALSGRQFSAATSINIRGQVVGYSY
jgi:probable HAF family extracellular repeat protein